MKHTLLAGFAALIAATTMLGAEPKSPTPTPATARAVRPQDPGRAFMMNTKLGIFAHYRAFHTGFAPGKPNPKPWDLDALVDAFDVKQFADAAEDMGAQYVIMTSFHASMYLLGPSKVMVDIGMPKHQAKRDLLGELADELNKRNIALCLYVHPTDQHDLSQEERALFGWGPEVNGQPGPKLGLWPNPQWDDFLLGLFKEISLRYGKRVSGYWIDQHTGKLFPDAGRLAVALRAGNPDAVIWQNSGAYVPVGLSLEDAWPAAEGGQIGYGTEDQQCLLPLKNTWYQGEEVELPVDELFRAVVRHNGCPGQKKCGISVALTPYATGYAPKVKVLMAEFGKLWRERKVSLLDTRPSTILKIEQKTRPWPLVATDSADGKTVYVHVLIPPAGQSISLPALADARKLLDAALLLGGKQVQFKQSDEAVELSLPGDAKWDPVDTVIVLKVGPAFEPGVLLSENAKLEISSTCGHDVAANHARLFSGDKIPFAFHTDNEKNPWAKIDLGAVRTVRTVEIENRDGEQERTKGLIMSLSEDGEKWEEVWQAKSWATTWLVRLTQSSGGTVKAGRKARFIKLETRGESPRPLVLRRVTVFGLE